MRKNVIVILAIVFLVVLILLILRSNSTAPGHHHGHGHDPVHCTINLEAKPNGKTDASKELQDAWTTACGSESTSTICFAKGEYLVEKALTFDGKNCKSKDIRFVLWGTVVGPDDFKVLGDATTWLSFEDVDGVSMSGRDGGGFDGKGSGLWDCKTSSKENCPRGVTTLRFTNSANLVIDGLTSLNSQLYHIVIEGCNNVQVEGVTVTAPSTSINTDGIHVEQSTGVTIMDSTIGTGDDCVSIGAGTNNLWIENVACGPGHGISIGSLGKKKNEDGVQNVTVKTATFTGSTNGVRIKSWGRPSNGYVKNILFQDLKMVNAQNPIIIDQHYCPGHKNCPGEVSGIQISDVTYQNIQGSSATEIAVKFDCSSEHQCTNIKLDDVNLTYEDHEAQSFCANVVGSVSGNIEPKSCLYYLYISKILCR